MKKFASTVLGATLLFSGLVVSPDSTPLSDPSTTDPTAAEHNEVIQQYCVRCHGTRIKKADLSLLDYDVAAAENNPELSEKIAHKLRVGLMPPPGQTRPEKDVLWEIADAVEERVDAAAAGNPNPGRRTFQRLNQAEYARSVHDLLGMQVDVSRFLPGDTVSAGFDNIADVQGLSPTLLEGYLRAAVEVSRLAVGDPDATPADTSYRIPRTASQLGHVEGAPIGTRGGLSRTHIFPADAEYVFKIQFHTEPTGRFFGLTAPPNELEISIDGERVALIKVDRWMSEGDPQGAYMQTDPILVKAGPHRLSAAFINQTEGPVEDLLQQIHHTLADTQIGTYYAVTTVPHVRLFVVSGPFNVTGVSETPIRRRIFTERPISAADELPSASKIISRLATRAYRRPLTDEDLQGLLGFYKTGAQEKGFEHGIRLALQAILASPHFVFRFEQPDPDAAPGEVYQISDLDLASRLSFFLWVSPPDEELLALANQGELGKPEVLGAQVERMLRDPRAETLATRFAYQWLRLQDLGKVHPDALVYPMYDHTLSEAMGRETELLFNHLVQEDRNVLELITADYTFVNGRLAQHYGIDNVTGPEFQRVRVEDEKRRGILGHGSFLTSTSQANRTSAVQRGKWVLEVLLGSPPPAPPPNVPELEETGAVDEGRILTTRERMAMHRANPACVSCHLVIDPIGVALEEFDVTGIWRRRDGGAPVDSTSVLFDGTELHGPTTLREALLARPETLIRTFLENLMTYALGRRLEYYDMPAIREIARDAAANDNRMSSFIKGIVHSAAFRMSRAEGVTRR